MMANTKPEISIRRAVLNDWPAIEVFISKTYGADAEFKGRNRWYWQFVNNPLCQDCDHAPSVWIAEHGGQVVGQIAVQDGTMLLNGKKLPAGWIVDVMVDPEFRGLGLAHKIHDAVMRDRQNLFTLTMAPATRRVAERAGCVTLGDVRSFIRPIRISPKTVSRFVRHMTYGRHRRHLLGQAFLRSLVGPIAVAVALRILSHLSKPERTAQPDKGMSFEEIGDFSEEVDAFWQETAERYEAVFTRSPTFLNWRFLAAPDLAYRRFVLRRNEKVCGFLVTRLGDDAELPLGVITDFFADPADNEALDLLISYARTILEENCEFIQAAASTGSYQAALRRAGFYPVKTMRPTAVCADSSVRDEVAQRREAWHFSKADHDWDQVHPI